MNRKVIKIVKNFEQYDGFNATIRRSIGGNAV